MKSMHGDVKTIPADSPHPDCELDEHGLWTFKDIEPKYPPNGEIVTKLLKFHATTRECPFCSGEQVVLTRNFQPQHFTSVESLACGHAVLISRETKGSKGKFLRWRLVFKDATK